MAGRGRKERISGERTGQRSTRGRYGRAAGRASARHEALPCMYITHGLPPCRGGWGALADTAGIYGIVAEQERSAPPAFPVAARDWRLGEALARSAPIVRGEVRPTREANPECAGDVCGLHILANKLDTAIVEFGRAQIGHLKATS